MIEISQERLESIKQLAKSDDLKVIVDAMKEQYKDSWAATRMDDVDGRDHLYRMITACDAFISEMQRIASSDRKLIYNERLKNRSNGSYIGQAQAAPERY